MKAPRRRAAGPSRPADARAAALAILERVRGGAPFDAALDAAVRELPDDERRLAHELAAGVLRERARLDLLLSPHALRGWDGVQPVLQDILRLGAYQLAVLDRIPPHAAVSETVALARRATGEKPSGFVNAVLRKVATAGARLPMLGGGTEARSAGSDTGALPLNDAAPRAELQPSLFSLADPATTESDAEIVARLASNYSHPAWLVTRWLERFGARATERLLRWNNTRPALVLQPARASFETLAGALDEAGIRWHPAPYGAGLVVAHTRPDALPGFAEGAFLVQDPAQALVAWFAEGTPGDLVLDCCAAPGGKTLAAGRQARLVIAADRQPDRARRLAANLARAGSGRERVMVADARHPAIREADLVHLDAPCLGTGTFGRHPDARHRVTEAALRELAEQQADLLDAAAVSVRPGGRLVYSTCSLEPEENVRQVSAFLERHPDFRREPHAELPAALLSAEGDLCLLPQQHGTDGAFAARLRRDA